MATPKEDSKVCSRCKQAKPLTEFYWKWKKPGDPSRYRAAECKTCTKKLTAIRSKRPEVKTVNNASKRAANGRLKEAAFAAYGGYKCACCSEQEKTFLTIDHVNNDGAEWRRKHLGSRAAAGVQTYRWLAKNGYPEGFQVLCMNCQWGKKMNKGICPHSNNL